MGGAVALGVHMDRPRPTMHSSVLNPDRSRCNKSVLGPGWILDLQPTMEHGAPGGRQGDIFNVRVLTGLHDNNICLINGCREAH